MTNLKRNTKLALATIAVAAIFTSSMIGQAAANDPWNSLYDRIIRLEAKVDAQQAGQGGSGNPGQVNALEQQMRQLTGQVQEMGYQLQRMQAQLQALEKARREGKLGPKPIRPADNSVASTNSGPGVANSLQPLQPSQMSQYQYNDTDVPQMQIEPFANDDTPKVTIEMDNPTVPSTDTPANAPGTLAPGPQVLGQLNVPQPNTQGQLPATRQPAANNGSSISQQPLAPLGAGSQPVGTQPVGSEYGQPSLVPEKIETANLDGSQISATGAAEQLYQKAYTNMLNRQFSEAEGQFSSFLAQFPDDKREPAVKLYLGEAYFSQGKYKLAAQSLLSGYRKYPKSGQAPATLLKLGMALDKLGQNSQACGTFKQVEQQYPKAGNAITQAKAQLKKSGC